MKSKILLTSTCALLVALSIQTTAAPQSYPLRVRGGRLNLSLESTRTPSLVKLIVQFQPGPGAAGAGLRPGQGSWLDRGLRPGEPARLEYYMDEHSAGRIVEYLRSTGNYYVFECYNTGKGYMQVTKAYVKSVRID